jgi:pimeloyl-ACP methyl ester carboxylesterase
MPFVHINGAKLHYHVKGQGIPIVFIHPPLITSRTFAYQLQQLSDQFQVVTFDLRGHGESPYSKAPLTYALLTEDIRQLLDELGIKKAYIAGYSSGGALAMEAVLRYPERFYGGILISSMSEVSSFYMLGEIWAGIRLSAIHAKRLLAASVSAANADSLRTFKSLYTAAIKGDARNLHQYLRMSFVYKCTDRLDEIAAPVLLLYGEKDGGFGRYAQILHDRLPNNSLHVFSRARHHLPTKEAVRMNAVIREWIGRIHPALRGRAPAENERPYGLLPPTEETMHEEHPPL